MIKRYCDVCGKEVQRSVTSERYRPSAQKQGVRMDCEIMVAIEGTWNAGDLCLSCLKDIVANGQEKESPLRVA